MNNGFLPVSRAEMEERGIKQFDFVYVIGDAYVDHPSFGHAIISRLLEAHGYSVGIISQPDWRDKESVCIFGEPRLGFLVSAGNMDSMVNHYSVSKKRRATDAFTPGGVMGKRPDYATIVYCNLLRQTYKHTPIIIGGIEASLRRLAHYDYWSNKMKRSILLDSGADLISYGMGEHSIVEIADALNSGLAVSDITFIDGTVYKTRKREDIYDAIELPHYEEVLAERARRTVSRIGERLFPEQLLFFIHGIKIRILHVDFPADLQILRCLPELLFHVADHLCIRRDILAEIDAVAARLRERQLPVLIAQRHRKSVDLILHDKLRIIQLFFHLCHKIVDLFF